MKPSEALEHLIHVLHTHGIDLRADDVRWVFEAADSRDDVTSWVERHLGQETLLSTEEAQLFSRLEKSGIAHQISSDHDLPTERPLGDGDYQEAVKVIQSSTAAIETQSQELRIRLEALSNFEEKVRRSKSQWKRGFEAHCQKRLRERQHLSLANEELSNVVSTLISEARRRLLDVKAALLTNFASFLKGDDNILDQIDHLAQTSAKFADGDSDSIDESSVLCKALADHLTAEVRLRLDRVYLEAQRSFKDTASSTTSGVEELEVSLQEELQSLYSEIGAVAEMSITHEFEQPIKNSISEKNSAINRRAESVFDYADAAIAHLVATTTEISRRLESFASHLAILEHLSAKAVSLESEDLHLVGSSPTKQDLGPPHFGAVPRDTHSSDGTFPNGSEDCVQRLLSSLGISYVNELSLPSAEDTWDAIASNRELTKIEESRRVHSSIDASLGSALLDVSKAQNLLLDALYADTQDRGIELFDQDLTSGIKRLEMEIENLGSEMAQLDFDALQAPNEIKDRFVAKWAGER